MISAILRRIRRKLSPPIEVIEGYEQAELVETIFQKTKLYEPEGTWPLMDGISTVLDFGGGCGVHYKLARLQSPDVRWAVVETPAMVQRASELSTDRLRFFADIDEAANWLGSIEIMHCNGALQYTAEPLRTLDQLCALRAKTMFWQRMLLSNTSVEQEVQVSVLSDNGPGTLPASTEKIVKYARIKIPEVDFLAAHGGYKLTERGEEWFRFNIETRSRH